jgi:hypothetical protein
MKRNDIVRFSFGDPPYQIHAHVIINGSDLTLVIGGGTHYHTGAVAVAWSHPSIKDPQKLTSTASLISLTGHKEDLIARKAALKLSKTLHTTVTVISGLHIDDASPQDIDILIDNHDQLIELIQAHFM